MWGPCFVSLRRENCIIHGVSRESFLLLRKSSMHIAFMCTRAPDYNGTYMLWAGIILNVDTVFLCSKAFSLEPVRLIFKQENVQYSVRQYHSLSTRQYSSVYYVLQEPTVVVRSSDGHIDNSSRNSQLRPHSPTWRNSSLSRELPAIPDVPENTINRNLTRYESASNLYACLDDVRVREAIDPQSSDSSRETSFPVRVYIRRVIPGGQFFMVNFT